MSAFMDFFFSMFTTEYFVTMMSVMLVLSSFKLALKLFTNR